MCIYLRLLQKGVGRFHEFLEQRLLKIYTYLNKILQIYVLIFWFVFKKFQIQVCGQFSSQICQFQNNLEFC